MKYKREVTLRRRDGSTRTIQVSYGATALSLCEPVDEKLSVREFGNGNPFYMRIPPVAETTFVQSPTEPDVFEERATVIRPARLMRREL